MLGGMQGQLGGQYGGGDYQNAMLGGMQRQLGGLYGGGSNAGGLAMAGGTTGMPRPPTQTPSTQQTGGGGFV